jgi:O-antigen/teichoic acid export membrane protein
LLIKFLNSKEKRSLLFSQIIIASIGLAIGKIIATCFSPEDFGLFNLQFAVYTFFFSLFISPFVHYFKTVCSTLLLKTGYKHFLFLGIALMAFLFLSVVSIFTIHFAPDFLLFIIILIFIPTNFLFFLFSDYFNLKNKFDLFSGVNLIKNIGSLLLLAFIYFFNYNFSNGTLILWVIQFIGFLLAILFYFPFFQFDFTGAYKISFRNFIKRYSFYVWPLMVLAFWNWINNYFDRFAIEYYLDFASVGIYNANYSIGSKFFLLLNPIFLMLLTPKIYRKSSLTERKEVIIKYVKFYTLLSIPLLFVIYFCSDIIGALLLSLSYKPGFYLIFWIALAYFFLTVVFLYETILYAEGKTKFILFSNIISALFNIILNILLIPLCGLNGAFFSTLISFVMRFLLVHIYFRKL